MYIRMFVYANEKDIRRFAKEVMCENRLASAGDELRSINKW